VAKDGTVYAGSGDGDYYPERQIYGQAIIGVKQNPEIKALEMKDWLRRGTRSGCASATST
jgi:hypothetical protein